MSILTGPEIKKCISDGVINVDPYQCDNVGTNSIDLTLGGSLKYYVDKDGLPLDVAYRQVLLLDEYIHEEYSADWVSKESRLVSELEDRGAILDLKEKNRTSEVEVGKDGVVLFPGRGYLAATVECVGTNDLVPILHGRSSVGRLFISVHHTAGFGDTGFNGTWTLEVTVEHPTRVYPDTRVCQLAFVTPKGDLESYGERKGSKYNKQTLPGASKFFQDFDTEGPDE